MSGGLEKYYSGDASWKAFVGALSVGWNKCDVQDELIDKLSGHVDVAMVCFQRFPRNIFKVIEEKSPSLSGLSIADCCKDKRLLNRVREMLMRMP